MRTSPRKVFGILIAAILILVGAGIAAAKLCPGGGVPKGDQTLAQPGWRLAQPITFDNLTIFPVVSADDANTSEFATLDEALASGDALVTEQGASMRRMRDGSVAPNYSIGPQVNQLVLINRGKRPLILLAGEVVSGGKQDRVIGKDRIVPVGAAPLPLDVFCVEHGRWSSGATFVASKTIVHPSVREKAAVD